MVAPFLGSIFIVLGLIMVFVGARFIEFVFAGLIGIAIGGVVFLVAYNQVLNQYSASMGALIGVLIVSFLFGALGSYLGFKFAKRWAIPVVAAGGGVALILPLSKVVSLHGTPALIVSAIVGAGLGFYLGLKLEKYVKRIGTAMIGAFLFTRGLGSVIGNYPSNFEDDASNGKFKYDPVILGYMACFITMTIVGSVFQIRHSRENNDDEFSGEAEEHQGKCC